MTQFHPLRVVDVHHDTRDSVVVTFEPTNGDANAFEYAQGQYLTFRREINGEELRRCYSICSSRKDKALRVGIKKVDDGWFSTWANETLNVGDTVEAMPPMGNFYVPVDPTAERTYLGFAGGSGITPLLSIIKTVLDEEPKSTFTLIYGNRSAPAIMFREELEDLKNTYLGRLSIVHVLESEAEIPLFSGRLDRQKCDALFKDWVDVKNADLAFICGPEPMMLAVADALKAHGMAEDAIKFELFKSAPRATGPDGAALAAKAEKRATACHATAIIDGVPREFEITEKDQTFVDAALAAGVSAPYSCKAGVCSTCRGKVLEGEGDMIANYALEDYEVEAGYVLTCQYRPTSEKVVISYEDG